MNRHRVRGTLRCGEIFLALLEALEELIAFTAAPHQYVLVLQHGLDDAQDRLGAQIVGAVKAVYRFEDGVLAQAGYSRALCWKPS
jgi:hypothetical protein